ncbi:Ras-related protein RabA5c-like protein, partial [Tanacetum coccineum]
MLVGNKCELDNIRAVSVEDGKNLAEKHKLLIMETTALDSTNVKTTFKMVIKEIYNNVSQNVLNSDSYKAELSVNRVTLSNNVDVTFKLIGVGAFALHPSLEWIFVGDKRGTLLDRDFSTDRPIMIGIVWKLNTLGLLLTHASDWVSSLTPAHGACCQVIIELGHVVCKEDG